MEEKVELAESGAMTATELDEMISDEPCEDCGKVEDHIFLDPLCHPEAPVYVAYGKGSGQAVLFCYKCDTPFLSLALSVGGH